MIGPSNESNIFRKISDISAFSWRIETNGFRTISKALLQFHGMPNYRNQAMILRNDSSSSVDMRDRAELKFHKNGNIFTRSLVSIT